MAYSTQKEFFNIPFMNETIEIGCLKACVKLKSYESTYDDRAWANDTEKSHFLTDLVACRTNISAFDDDLSDGDDNHGKSSNKIRSEASSSKKAGGIARGESEKNIGRSGKGENRKNFGLDDDVAGRSDGKGGGGGGSGRMGGVPGRDTVLISDANDAMKRLESILLKNKNLEDQLSAKNKELTDAANERIQLREKLNNFDEMEKKVAELQKQTVDSARGSIEISENLEKQTKRIEYMESELKKTEEFYEEKIKEFLQNEHCLKRQLCKMKQELNNAKKDNDVMSYESTVLQAALDAYDCQYKQLMKVVEDFQYSMEQNDFEDCFEEIANLTTHTLLEIKKELENRKVCSIGDGIALVETKRVIFNLREENSGLKEDCEKLCCETFRKLKSIREENEMLRKAFTELQSKNKEMVELLNHHKINIDTLKTNVCNKLLDLEKIVDITTKQSSQLEVHLCLSSLLLNKYETVCEENSKKNRTTNDLKNDQDEPNSVHERKIDNVHYLEMCEIAKKDSIDNIQSRTEDPTGRAEETLKEEESPDRISASAISRRESVTGRSTTRKTATARFSDSPSQESITANSTRKSSNISDLGIDYAKSDRESDASSTGIQNNNKSNTGRRSGGQSLPSSPTVSQIDQLEHGKAAGISLIQKIDTSKGQRSPMIIKTLPTNISDHECTSKPMQDLQCHDDICSDEVNLSEQGIGNCQTLNAQDKIKREFSVDAFNEFVNSHAQQMKHKVRHGGGFTREIRAILDAFVVECGFCYCKDCVPKSKFYAICHKILHCGIQNVSFKHLVYFQKQIHKIIDNKRPGWLLENILEEQLGVDGLKCCQCKNTLCCTTSEEMLKEKVLKLEQEIAMARTYLEECKSYSSNTNLRNKSRVSDQENVTSQNDATTFKIKSRFSTRQRIMGF